MKILHLTDLNTPPGIQESMLDLIKLLAQRDIEQAAITGPDRYVAACLERLGIRHKREKFSGLFDLKTPQRIQEMVEEDNFDLVLAYDQNVLRYFQRALFLPPLWEKASNKAGQLPLPVIMDQKAIPLERADIQTPPHAFVIGTIAHLHKNKTLPLIIKAMRELSSVHLWISGQGPDLERLQNLSQKQGLQDRVHCLGIQQNRADFLSALDICFSCSSKPHHDRLSLESAAYKTPFIHYNTANDVNGWRQIIETLMRDELLRERIKKENHLSFEGSYNPSSIADQHIDYFKSVISF